jgi:hypothetical protein
MMIVIQWLVLRVQDYITTPPLLRLRLLIIIAAHRLGLNVQQYILITMIMIVMNRIILNMQDYIIITMIKKIVKH